MCETSFSAYIHVNYLIQVNPLMHTYTSIEYFKPLKLLKHIVDHLSMRVQ